MVAGPRGKWRGKSDRSVHRSGSAAHKHASMARVREAIASGEELLDRNGSSLTTGKTVARGFAPSDVTPAGRAFSEIRHAAFAGLKEAAYDVVMPDAVDRAPLLVPENYKRAGRWGGNQGGAPEELKKSAKIVADEEASRVELSFNTIYAALQHEKNWNHADGQSKYLEDAMVLNRNRVLEVIAARVREVTGG